MSSNQKLLLWAGLPILLLATLWSSTLNQYVPKPQWTADSSPQVRISQGLIIGALLNEGYPAPIEGFMGFPYAQSPLENRRFKRAVPLPASNSIFEAKKYGPRCPSKPIFGDTSSSSEDCMSVNIFRPKLNNSSKKLPVAVYIHGGAFNRGSSGMHNTASMVAWSEEPFIAVSFNYRLGALGFLPSKLMFEEGGVNLGLHDQVFLLQWVKDNIGAFGGDADDVTIFGLSAGAHSIGHHMMNYKDGVTPLFHKVIIESGAPTSRAVHPYDASLHEEQFSLFVSKAGCDSTADSAGILACLRSQPIDTIDAAQSAVFNKYGPSLRWAFQPVIDADLITQRPIDAWSSGQRNRMPILTGHTTNEGTYYVPPSLSTPDSFTAFWHVLLPHYSPEDLATVNTLYPDPSSGTNDKYLDTRNISALSIGPQYKRVEQAYAHYAYACPVRQTADLASSTQDAPVYVYHWALNQTVKGGANHGDNMWYETYQDSVTGISAAQKEVAGMLHAYMTAFIVSGDPNSIRGRYAERPLWDRYVRGEEKVMTFGKGNEERAGGAVGVPAQMLDSGWIEDECSFWWRKSRDTEEE